jgi:hypothetical protein
VLDGVLLPDPEVLGVQLVLIDLGLRPFAGLEAARHEELKPPALPQRGVLEQAKQGQRTRRRRLPGVRVADPLRLPDQYRALEIKEPAQRFPFGCGRELRNGHAPRRYRSRRTWPVEIT